MVVTVPLDDYHEATFRLVDFVFGNREGNRVSQHLAVGFQPPVGHDMKKKGLNVVKVTKKQIKTETRNQSDQSSHLAALENDSSSCHVSSLPTIHHSAEWRRSGEGGRQSEQLKAGAVSPSLLLPPPLSPAASLLVSSPQSHKMFNCDTKPSEYFVSFT